jgi:ribosome maturation factor RimP
MAVRPDNESPKKASGRTTAKAAASPANHAEAGRIRSLLEPTVIRHNLYLEDVDIRVHGSHRTVHVVVDLPETETGGVGLDLISDVSRDLSAVLDTDPYEYRHPYDLEVSSPGATRPLTEPRHWRRAMGRMIKIKVIHGDDVTGRLLEVAGDGVTVRPELPVKKGTKPRQGEPVHLPFEKIRRGTVEIEFARPGEEPGSAEDFDDGDDVGTAEKHHG